jgi:sarcosine oxidase, subunit gamma
MTTSPDPRVSDMRSDRKLLEIAWLEARMRFSLRSREIGSVVVEGIVLERQINSFIAIGTLTIARLGPDEWLMLDAMRSPEGIRRAVSLAFEDKFYSLVEISDRHVAVRVRGDLSRALVNGACPMDLSDQVFPLGSATRTVLGKAEIVLLRTTDGFEIECGRSFGSYVGALLAHNSRQFLNARAE